MKMALSHVNPHQIISTTKEAFSNKVDMVISSIKLVNLFPQCSQCLLNGPMNQAPIVEGLGLHMDSKPGLVCSVTDLVIPALLSA